MTMTIRTLAAVTLLGLPIALPAADNGFYLGGSIGQAGVSFEDTFDGEDIDFDAEATGYKLIAGWRFLDWLAVEVDWVDLGTADDKLFGEKVETSFDGLTGSVVGFLPVGPVDLMARAGVYAWDGSVEVAGFDLGDDGTDFTYGVGAQFRVWSLSLRAEYERFEISDADTVDLISVGVTWTFL
jgi:OOP family OmpA-OmpF porin